jgi:hypothetical protein
MWCCYEESVVSIFESVVNNEFLFDIVAAAKSETPVLTDGLASIDFRRTSHSPSFWKTRRESLFPLHVIKSALQLDVTTAQASREEDQRHILNAIAGQPLESEPLLAHDRYDVVNRYLRASFAIPCWRQILEKGLLTELDLPGIVAKDAQRVTLKLNLSGSTYERPAEGLADALQSLRELMDLNLDFSQTSLASDDMTSLLATVAATQHNRLSQLSLNLSYCKVTLRDLQPAFQMAGLVDLRLLLAGDDVLEGLGSFGRWLPKCGTLRNLDLSFESCCLGDQALEEWPDFTGGVAQLNSLEACSMKLDFIWSGDTDALSSLCASLRGLAKLKNLRLTHLSRHKLDTYRWLIDGQDGEFWQEMEDLSIMIYDCDAKKTAGFEGLASLQKLKRLSVNLGENRYIRSMNELWTGLTCKDKGRNNLEDFELILHPSSLRMPKFLHTFPNLKHLTLFAPPISFNQLAEELADLAGLKKLVIGSQAYTDSTDLLFAAVGRLRHVEVLSLQFLSAKTALDVGSLFASSIDGGLASLKELTLLAGQGVYFGELKGLGAFAKGMLHAPSLQKLKLDFDGCYARNGQSKGAAEDIAALVEAVVSFSFDQFFACFKNCFQLPKELQNEFFSSKSLKEAHEEAVKSIVDGEFPGHGEVEDDDFIVDNDPSDDDFFVDNNPEDDEDFQDGLESD